MQFVRFFAAVSVCAAATFSGQAHADDWGCEVLLCLSNPAGPMAVAQCVPPIKRLYAALTKLHPDPFPTCEQATASNHAGVDFNDYYDPCPEGTTALGPSTKAVQGTAEQIKQQNKPPLSNALSNYVVGIGEGSAATLGILWQLAPKKICVGNYIGAVYIRSVDDGFYSVNVYDRIATVDRASSGFAIKVWLDNKLARVIRPASFL